MSSHRLHGFCVPVLLIFCATAARTQTFTHRENTGDSLLWVHAGVTAQLAGTFADWATSWKQPEGNFLLRDSGGQYERRFYRTGTAVKFGLAGGVAAASYVIGWKFPKARRYVGIFNFGMGGGFAVQALRNIANNPYYKP